MLPTTRKSFIQFANQPNNFTVDFETSNSTSICFQQPDISEISPPSSKVKLMASSSPTENDTSPTEKDTSPTDKETSLEEELEIPEELIDKLLDFQRDFEKMTEVLKPLTEIQINSRDLKLDPLDRARLNLVSGFALNSLFWMYLRTIGVNPHKHKIKKELERYKSYFARIKELTDKDKAPTLDKEAAGRFVQNALWTPKDTEIQKASTSTMEQDGRKKELVRVKQEEELYISGEKNVKSKKQDGDKKETVRGRRGKESEEGLYICEEKNVKPALYICEEKNVKPELYICGEKNVKPALYICEEKNVKPALYICGEKNVKSKKRRA